jgi:hypothetical protein
MRVRIEDTEALRAVRPLDLAAYLRAAGWKEVDPASTEPAVLWEATGDGKTSEILTPKHPDWRDYPRRVREAIATLAEFEQRSQLAILRDVSEVSTDVVRLTALNGAPGDGTLPLADGIQLVGSGRGLMMAAACSATKPQRAYPSRKPAEAAKYIESLRLGQSERGSYVVTIMSPVPPILATHQMALALPGVAPTTEEPFSRRVTRTLAIGLERVMWAAGRGVASGEMVAFEEAVKDGVSADLCEALALVRECGHVTSVEIRVGWAPSRPLSGDVPAKSVFTRDILDVVEEAGRVLREREPVPDFELVGPVIDLSRPEADLWGTATVLAVVGGKQKKVSLDLHDADWKTAYAALKDRQMVLRCTGELEKTATLYRVTNPRGVVITRIEET